MSWPNGGDPFYTANQSENNTRRYYYPVNSTPTMKCDGGACGTTQSGITYQVNTRLAIDSPVWLGLELAVNGSDLDITCNATANQTISGNYTIHLVLVNRYEYISNSPNGNPHHYAAMLKMAPSGSGQLFTASSVDTSHYYGTIALDPTWELQNLDLVAFVQNNTTKEVIQATQDAIPLDFPNIFVADYSVVDLYGNDDGRVDPGETGEFVITLENQVPFHDAVNVEAMLATDDPLITITSNYAAYPDLASGASAANTANPFIFEVDPSFEAHEVTFNLTVQAQPGDFQDVYPLTFMVGRPDLFLVNDDFMGGYQSWYEEALGAYDVVYDSWVQVVQGAVPADELNRYYMVIWYTGDDAIAPLSTSEQSKLENFLMGGGRLFLSSQNAGDVIGSEPFYEDILHAQHIDNTLQEFMLTGVTDDPISDGMSLALIGSSGAGNASSNSNFNPIAPAEGIFTYDQSSSFGALRCEAFGTRFIYFALPFEAVSGMLGTTPRAEVLNSCIEWLYGDVGVEPGVTTSGLPQRVELTGVYPNPFNPSTEVSFALPQQGPVRLAIYNLQGRNVQTLIDGSLAAGRYQIPWQAQGLPSGLYFVTLQTQNSSITTKALLIK